MDTIEIRWFFESPPQRLMQLTGEVEARTDWYAPIASPDSSVKWREQRLESKFLADRAPADRTPKASGWQRWSKVSLALPAAETRRTGQLVEATWLPVEKVRTIHMFCVDGQGQVEPTQQYVDAVRVEWGRVALPAITAWTLCVESLASAGTEAGECVLDHLKTKLHVDPLDFPPPRAYPAWLLEKAIALPK